MDPTTCPNCAEHGAQLCPLCATYGAHGGPCFHGPIICADDAADGLTIYDSTGPLNDQAGVSALCLLAPDHDGAHSDGLRVWVGVTADNVPCAEIAATYADGTTHLCERTAYHTGGHMSALHILGSARHISEIAERTDQ